MAKWNQAPIVEEEQNKSKWMSAPVVENTENSVIDNIADTLNETGVYDLVNENPVSQFLSDVGKMPYNVVTRSGTGLAQALEGAGGTVAGELAKMAGVDEAEVDRIVSRDHKSLVDASSKVDIPTETLAGEIATTLGQFAIPAGIATKAVSKLPTAIKLATVAPKTAKIAIPAVAGAGADFAVMNEAEDNSNLGNLIEDTTGIDIGTGIDEDDSPIEMRLKTALEGAGIGILSDLAINKISSKIKSRQNSSKEVDEAIQQADDLENIQDVKQLPSPEEVLKNDLKNDSSFMKELENSGIKIDSEEAEDIISRIANTSMKDPEVEMAFKEVNAYKDSTARKEALKAQRANEIDPETRMQEMRSTAKAEEDSLNVQRNMAREAELNRLAEEGNQEAIDILNSRQTEQQLKIEGPESYPIEGEDFVMNGSRSGSQEDWINNYINNLNKDDTINVKQISENTGLSNQQVKNTLNDFEKRNLIQKTNSGSFKKVNQITESVSDTYKPGFSDSQAEPYIPFKEVVDKPTEEITTNPELSKSFWNDQNGNANLGVIGDQLKDWFEPDQAVEFAKEIVKSPTYAKKVGNYMSESAKLIAKDPLNSPRIIGRFLFKSNGQALRNIADASDNKAIKELTDSFDTRLGRVDGDTITKTVPEKMDEVSKIYNNKIADIISDNKNLLKDKTAQKQIRRLITNRSKIDLKKGGKIHNVADRMSKILDELHEVQRKAGVKIGQVEDYFPRQFDASKVTSNKIGFVNNAKEAYKSVIKAEDIENEAEAIKNGISYKLKTDDEIENEARSKALGLLDQISLGEIGMSRTKEGLVKPEFQKFGLGDPTKERVFDREADKLLEDFYTDDLIDNMASYIFSSARRSAWTEKFGPDSEKYYQLLSDIEASDKRNLIPFINSHVMSSIGLSGGASQAARNISSVVSAWNSLSLLSGATISSIMDPFNAGLRSGKMTDSLRAISDTLYGTLFKRDPGYADDVVDSLGIISRPEVGDIVGNRLADGITDIKNVNSAVNTFFEATRLGRLTRESKVAGSKVAMRFMNNLADRIVKNKDPEFVAGFFKELGVDPSEARDFSEYILKYKGQPPIEDMNQLNGTKFGKLYGTAIRRFVDSAAPDAKMVNKPYYANHPLGRMMFGITSYSYSFYDNVLRRMGNMAKRATTDKDLTVSQRYELLKPALMLPVGAMMAYGMNQGRNYLLNPDLYNRENEGKDRNLAVELIGGISRISGFHPMIDRAINFGTNARYGSSATTALLGPGAGQVDKLGALAGIPTDLIKKGEVSNATARNSLKAIIDTVLAPLAGVAISYGPGGILKAGAIPTVESSRTKNALVDTVFEKDSKKNNEFDFNFDFKY